MLIVNILRTGNLLTPHLGSGIREPQLTAAQFNVLLLLSEAGEAGLAMGEIGRKLVVTKANVTGLIDRMEAKGLLSRQNTVDRRVTIVKLTDKGKSTTAYAIPEHRNQLADLLVSLSREEKAGMIRLLTKLRHGVRHATGCQTKKTGGQD